MEETVLEDKLPEIKNVNTTLVERAATLCQNIVDRPSLDLAVDHGKEIDRRLKWWEDFIGPVVSQAHKTWKMMTERREEVAAPLRRAKVSLSSAIGHYKAEEEKKRLAEEAKIRSELQKQAEDQKLSTAAALESAGQKEAAEAVLDEPVITPPVVLPNQTDTDGTYTRTNWKFRIVSEALIPREFLCVDLKKIGQVVRAMKERTSIPGVEVTQEKAEVFSER